MSKVADNPAQIVSRVMYRPDYAPLGKFIFVWLTDSIQGEESDVSVQWHSMEPCPEANASTPETIHTNFPCEHGMVHDITFKAWEIYHLPREKARGLWNHLIACDWKEKA